MCVCVGKAASVVCYSSSFFFANMHLWPSLTHIHLRNLHTATGVSRPWALLIMLWTPPLCYHPLWPSGDAREETNATDNADLHVDAVICGDHAGPHGSLLIGLGGKQLHGQDWSGGASRHPGTEVQHLLRPGGRSHVCWTHSSDHRWLTADLNREKPDQNQWATQAA